MLRIGALILAAGAGRRLGGDKLMRDAGGRPVVAHVAQAVASAGMPCVAVIGPQSREMGEMLARSGIVLCVAEDAASGQAHSLRAGIAALPEAWDAVIICLGDMPLIKPELLTAMAAQATRDAVIVPRFQGQRGNPVTWGRSWFARLSAVQGDIGARQVMAAHPEAVEWLEWGDDGILFDVDTPEDLEAARLRLA